MSCRRRTSTSVAMWGRCSSCRVPSALVGRVDPLDLEGEVAEPLEDGDQVCLVDHLDLDRSGPGSGLDMRLVKRADALAEERRGEALAQLATDDDLVRHAL